MIETTGQNEASGPPMLVNVGEVARMLSVSARTVWSLVRAGDLPVVRIGKRSTRFDPADVARLIAANKSMPAKESA